MSAERRSPHTSGADLRCSDCSLPFPAGIWPRCSDCGYWRCSGCELFEQVCDALAANERRVRGALQRQMSDALAAYMKRCARAKAAMSERSQGPPVSATAPIPTPPRITDEAHLPTVPSGWKAVYSVDDRAYYYWHIASNSAQWEDPNTTTAVAEVVDWAGLERRGRGRRPTLLGEDGSGQRSPQVSETDTEEEPQGTGTSSIDWAEPTTGTASNSIWGPPANTVRLPGTSSLPPPAPRSRWSRSSSSSGESLARSSAAGGQPS